MAPDSSMMWSGLMLLWMSVIWQCFQNSEQTYEEVRNPQLTMWESSSWSSRRRPCLWRKVTRWTKNLVPWYRTVFIQWVSEKSEVRIGLTLGVAIMRHSIWRKQRIGWPLAVFDDILADSGSISGWNMAIDSPEFLAIEDLANSFRELAEGEVVQLCSCHCEGERWKPKLASKRQEIIEKTYLDMRNDLENWFENWELQDSGLVWGGGRRCGWWHERERKVLARQGGFIY